LNIINGRQLRAARVLLDWEQTELAKKARVAIGTIRRMESFHDAVRCHADTLAKVMGALERAGIEFLNDERPGLRLRAVLAPQNTHERVKR
jgi:transcriptional regulator with XRE-family HTH domain